MRASAGRVWVTVACIGFSAIGFNKPSSAQEPESKKERKEQSEDEWLATKKLPQTAFPKLVPPPASVGADEKEWAKREQQLDALCPTLTGGLKIVATDGTLQKLQKARLFQSAIEIQRFRATLTLGFPDRTELLVVRDSLNDTLATATELYSGQPKELVACLEELVIMAKEVERIHSLRADAEPARQRDLPASSRLRLKIEAELWKVKNAK